MSLRIALEPLITPMFRTLWRFQRGMTLGVRGFAQDEAGRIMLVRHTYREGWYLPGGGVERGETAALSIRREMQEEAGVEAIDPPVLFGLYLNAAYPGDHVALFRLPRWRACATSADGEIAERGFFPADALPDGASPGTRRRIAEVLEGAPLSEIW